MLSPIGMLMAGIPNGGPRNTVCPYASKVSTSLPLYITQGCTWAMGPAGRWVVGVTVR